MTEQGFEQVAWSWVEHLRAGGATPWEQWCADVRPVESSDRAADLPGAAQLEFVRRLAERPAAQAVAFPVLADTVLSRSGPGRGAGDLPLRWTDRTATDAPGLGTPPVDPARVPVGELVRVGVGALTDLLLAAPSGTDPGPVRRLPWSARYRLAGAPVTAAAVRASLETGHHPEGGRRPQVVVVAAPIDVLLAQVWSTRVQRGGRSRWRTFLRRWSRRNRLPVSADLASVASRWARRVGPERVHVVVAADPATARRTVADILGVRAPEARRPAAVSELSPAAVELVRRVNRVLGVRVDEDSARRSARTMALALPTSGAALAVPDRYRTWAGRQAERIAEALASGGYAVHGDLGQVASRPDRAVPSRPAAGEVLDLALDACVTLADRRRT